MLKFERRLDTCDEDDLPIKFVSCVCCSLFHVKTVIVSIATTSESHNSFR